MIHKIEMNQISNMQKPKYLRSKDLASYLGIGESTVWYYLSKGIITKKKVSPRVTLFDVEEVEKALLLIEQ
ncbi:helix-turn-helix transcriptional regulator [Aliarcobacter cryaerophilus]|uniref:helix-turn-helix transcriptional regulator n=1 Tax=Aliarcobacter cryaerophilus TaxID=28198 RepID=UPI000833F722|nr:helix-turn-helix domain-containing protein [Aliarcobacter cryaerophilus]